MPAALPLSSLISQATQGKTTFKVLEVKYGNGYTQRAGDGINNNQGTWNIEYDLLTSSELSTVVTAFDTAAGVDYFTWQAPGDATSKKWLVKEYSRSPRAGDLYSVSAALEQVFDL
jgi:phage-related protein